MTDNNNTNFATAPLFTDEHFKQTDRQPVDIWDTPPVSRKMMGL